MEKQLKVQQNDPRKAGQHASLAAVSHDWRYLVRAIHTRHDAVQWFASDSERTDDIGFATVIRQEPTFDACAKDLGLAKIVGRNGRATLPPRGE